MRRRDRSRLQNWLLLCLLAAGAVVWMFGRTEQMAQRRQVQEQGQLGNGQAILADAAEASDDTEEVRSLKDWLPDVLLSEITSTFALEVWKAQSVLARTWLWNAAVEAGRAATVTDMQKEARLSLKELREAGWSGDGQEWAEADTSVQRLGQMSISSTEGVVLVPGSASVGNGSASAGGDGASAGRDGASAGGTFPPLFHLCSAGRTRDGGTQYPGLCAVDSTTDLLVTEAVSVQFFTMEQFAEGMTAVLGEELAAGQMTAEQIIKEQLSYEKDTSGYVTKLQWKRDDGTEKQVDLTAFQKQFALSSPWFEIAPVDGQIRMTCRGIGHGYGMSQCGAAAMAQQGKTWREILAWYFPQAKLEQTK